MITFELIINDLDKLQTKLKSIPQNSKIHLPDKKNSYSNLELGEQIKNYELGITFSLSNHQI